MVANGLTNQQIALELGISKQTVKNHMTDIFNRAGVFNRVSLVILAIRCGWIEFEDIDVYVDPWRDCV